MKNKTRYLLLVIFGFLVTSFQIQELPITNKNIVEFCKQHLKKRVGSGQCWDLAEAALNFANADWSAPYNFGDEIERKKTPLLAGDIIQFEKVQLESEGNFVAFPLHTAIVYKVLDKDRIIIVHQNFNGVKKLGTFELNLQDLTKGTIQFFRPKGK